MEPPTLKKLKLIVKNHNLEMKLVDVEYQGDKSKQFFIIPLKKRVDFRELIKELSKTFRIKIEMRQIGVRHESLWLGVLEVVESYCSTWMTEFPPVSTSFLLDTNNYL